MKQTKMLRRTNTATVILSSFLAFLLDDDVSRVYE